MLKFEIISSRTVEGFESEKKFVAYMLQVRQDSTESNVSDPDPSNVERRYTHFLDLYNGLKKEHPTLLNNLTFPRKVSGHRIYTDIFICNAYCLCIECRNKSIV